MLLFSLDPGGFKRAQLWGELLEHRLRLVSAAPLFVQAIRMCHDATAHWGAAPAVAQGRNVVKSECDQRVVSIGA